MSLAEELHELTEAVKIEISQVEGQEIYLGQLQTQNTKLKLKSQELELWLKQLITNIEEKNKFKSSLLEIRKDALAKSKCNVASGKRLAALREKIASAIAILSSKEEELAVLSRHLEKLRRWNEILKDQKEKLVELSCFESIQELENARAMKCERVKELEKKILNADNRLKELKARANVASERSKSSLEARDDPQYATKNDKNESKVIPIRLSNRSTPDSSSVVYNREGRLAEKPTIPSKEVRQNCRQDVSPSRDSDSEEEIFIIDPPCTPTADAPADVQRKLSNGLASGEYYSKDIIINRADSSRTRDAVDARPSEGSSTEGDTSDDDNNDIEFYEEGSNSYEAFSRSGLMDDVGDMNSAYTTVDGCRRIAKNPGSHLDRYSEIIQLDFLKDDHHHQTVDSQFRGRLDAGSYFDYSSNRREYDGGCPVPVVVPVRRHRSLGDLNCDDVELSLTSKRWSHQMELLSTACPDGFFIIKPPRRRNGLKGNLKRRRASRNDTSANKRVTFDPATLLFSATVEGEIDLVRSAIVELGDINASDLDGMTALHHAVFAENFNVVAFLVEEGCDVNVPDGDGWTPLHCAASCNDLKMCEFLVENGASIFAATFEDREFPSEKCDSMEEGFQEARSYLLKIEEEIGSANNGVVYALYDYASESEDELSFKMGDCLVVSRKGDDQEGEWWWSCLEGIEGYVPRNFVGMHPRLMP